MTAGFTNKHDTFLVFIFHGTEFITILVKGNNIFSGRSDILLVFSGCQVYFDHEKLYIYGMGI